MIDFYGMSTRLGLFICIEVRELSSLFIYIYIFCVITLEFFAPSNMISSIPT